MAFNSIKFDSHLNGPSTAIKRCGFSKKCSDFLFNQKEIIKTKESDLYCIAMASYNLADPRWIKIDCNKAIKTVLVCMDTYQLSNLSEMVPSTDFFEKSCTLIDNTCYLFNWCNVEITFCSRKTKSVNITLFEVLFKAISQVFSSIYLPKEQKIITYDKFRSELYFKEKKIDRYTEYYIISTENPANYVQGENLFKCLNNKYIFWLVIITMIARMICQQMK